MTARGNEIKMPLMRIRSVEIVFEDEMSACTDTALLDRSIELVDSDDSTECVDDLQERDAESITLNAEGDLSEDNSGSLPKDNPEVERISQPSYREDSTIAPSETASALEDVTLSLNASDVVDSGRFTEDASSSHMETVPIAYEDALLSQTFDAITVDNTAFTTYEVTEDCSCSKVSSSARLYEYIGSDSDSDSSDATAVCDEEPTHLPPFSDPIPDDHTLCDGSDLQYDSFIDMGKF